MIFARCPLEQRAGTRAAVRACPARWFLLSLAVAGLISSTKLCPAQSASNEIQSLKQLIEQQNRTLEALQEKVRRLEDRESQRSGSNARPVLPAIVIDTNGVPIGNVSPAPEPFAGEVSELRKRQDHLEQDAADQAKKAPRITIGASGFAFTSADTNFALRIKGIYQVDSRTFINDNQYSVGNDAFLFRRVRPIMEGTFFRDFDFLVMPDFAGASPTLYEAWINYRFAPELQLRAGKIRGPVGLENLFLDSLLLFNERSFVNDLVPTRNLGFELWGELFDARLSYAIGIFDGDGDGRLAGNTDFGDDKVYAGRLFLQPFRQSDALLLKGLGFGVGGSYGSVHSNSAALPGTTGGTLPGYFTPGQQQFFAYNPVLGNVVGAGPHWRISPQGFYNVGPFGFLGEYAISDQGLLNSYTLQTGRVKNTAWNLSLQWVLTGEPASLGGIIPAHPLSPLNGSWGGWGAWQIVGRLSGINIDPVAFEGFADPTQSASSARSWSLGLNWWLNRNVRILTSYSRTHFHGGGDVDTFNPSTTVPPATVSHQDEDVFFSRVQLAF